MVYLPYIYDRYTTFGNSSEMNQRLGSYKLATFYLSHTEILHTPSHLGSLIVNEVCVDQRGEVGLYVLCHAAILRALPVVFLSPIFSHPIYFSDILRCFCVFVQK